VFSDGLASRAIDHSGGLVCIWVDEFTFEALSDLVIGIGIPASGTTSMTPGTGFTSWSGSGGYNAVYQFASSAGTYTPTINENVSGAWGINNSDVQGGRSSFRVAAGRLHPSLETRVGPHQLLQKSCLRSVRLWAGPSRPVF